MEEKIEEFLGQFAELLSGLSEEAFQTQVTALVKLKEHEDAHLGEEVERDWVEVMTQQYIFSRLEKEVRLRKPAAEPVVQLGFWCRSEALGCSVVLQVEALKTLTREDLLSWFLEHRNQSRRLSVHVSVFESPAQSGIGPRSQRRLSSVGQVVGWGRKEDDPVEQSCSSGPAHGDVSQLTFVPACSPSLRDATLITDIRAFTSSLHLHPHHKILS